MFFGESFKVSFVNMMATHPPLTERIRRINRGYLLSDSLKKARAERQAETAAQAASADADGATADNIIESIGNPAQSHVVYAAALLSAIPSPVTESLSLQRGCQALLLVLVLDSDEAARQQEIQALKASEHAELIDEVARLDGYVSGLRPRYRLPLLEMALPVLKDLPQDRRDALMRSVKRVIDADGKIKLHELTMYALIKANLGRRAATAQAVKYKRLSALRAEVGLLITLLAWLGKSDAHDQADVFAAAAGELAAALPGLAMGDIRAFAPDDLVAALEKFALLSAALKQKLLRAALKAVMRDGRVSTDELEVVRAMCAAMDVPVPPRGEGEGQ